MVVSNKTYSLTPMKQLIDLNGDITNFDLTFTATTKDGSPFDLLVVDQTTLDSNPSLEYKKAQGTISGNIISDKGVYQNYFLLIKSETPCECDVSIDLKEIPQRKSEPIINSQQSKKKSLTTIPTSPKSTINWYIVLIAVIGGCALLWYFHKNTKSVSVIEPVVPIIENPPLPLVVDNPSESFSLSNQSSTSNKNLLDRLNKLKINK